MAHGPVMTIVVAYEADLLAPQRYRVTWNADGTCQLWHGDREVHLPQTQRWLAQRQKERQDASEE